MNRTEFKYIFLVVVIFLASCIETDIYLPAFPDMMTWFSVSEGKIQSLLTWNFLGICLSGPFYGPLSDAIGRKKPLMFSLGMFLIGSFITVYSQTFNQMLWGRILQGLGSGGCFTLGTVIIFDAFDKNKAIEANNKLNTITPLIMAFAPMLGAFLNHTYGFRSNFLAIAFLVSLSFLLCLFFYRETHPSEKRSPLHLKIILKDFIKVLTSLPFWQITLMCSLIFAGYISFLSRTSVLFLVEFHMSKTVFPFIQAQLLLGWVIASLIFERSLVKWGALKVKKIGITLFASGAFGATICALCIPNNPYFITVAMALYAFGANWMIGLYFPESMQLFPHIKGITASILSSIRLATAAIVVTFSSSIYNGTIYPLAGVIFGIIMLILPTIFFYEKKRSSLVLQRSDKAT